MDVKNFDATSIPPQQMGDKHPEGGFPFTITNTYGKANKDTPGGQFIVELTSPAGSILNRYNLWNQSDSAREIAHKELSALCHAVGVFRLTFEGVPPDQYGRELRNARGNMIVGPQKNNPEYMEVKKVLDAHGNEPGKAPANAPQTTQQQPANNGGGWGNQPAAATPPVQSGWGNSAPANNAPPANAGGGTGVAGAAPPPWAR